MEVPNQDSMEVQSMLRYLLPLSFSVLLFAAHPSLAQNHDISGLEMYKAAVTAAKLQVQPIKASYQPMDEKEALKVSQSAIGKQLGDYTFLSLGGRKVR